MPAIETKRSAGKPFDKVLQDVLNTEPNKWNYFFVPHRIKEVFSQLVKQIQSRNFFTADYSISTFLDFLKTYVKEKLTTEELKLVNTGILQEFNRVCMALQSIIIGHTTGLDNSQQKIVSNYLVFLRQLMEHQHRDLFAKTEITFNANNLQAIGTMLQHNKAFINEDLIENYVSLLKLSFDVAKFLAHYELGLGINPLAKDCFLNKNISIHIVSTKFFDLLAYQGQLLDYYRNDPKFNITDQLLSKANDNLKQKALDLQQYFFNNLNQRGEIDKALLQHYLYVHFFKVIYKKYPERIDALKTDRYLSYYIKLDYVALPNSLDCRNYLSADNKVIIEYKNLSTDIPEIACQAIVCSSNSYGQWQRSLGFHTTTKSRYIFRVGDSYEKYSFTYAYGKSPRAGGFYLTGEVKNNTVNGVAYSFFGDKHQFIDVSRHEAVHHDNFRLYLTALKSNRDITYFTNRNFNEGLAVLFAGGACAPGYSSQDFSNTTAPSLETLLNSEYIGYPTSWLYNNYFIQQYPSFYQDLLSLRKDDFKNRWTPILNQDQQHFFNWLPYLNQICQDAPKELSIEKCPSIYLNDYLPSSVTKPVTTTARLRRNTESVPGLLTAKKLTPDEMGRELIFKISRNELTSFKILLQSGANANYIENPAIGNTLLHYLYFYSNCDTQYLELLFSHAAKVTANNEGLLPYDLAEKNCNATQLQVIKSIFDKFAPATIIDTTTTKPEETGLILYQQRKLAITIGIPITSFLSGVIAGGCKEISERHSKQYSYLPNIIFYGLRPMSLALTSATMNFLLAGSAESLGLEDAWLSFAYYLGMNYLGLMIAQLGEKATKKIQNKILKLLLPILLYTFFLNPSLIITLLSEGFGMQSFQAVMMPLLSILPSGLFFKAGEWSTQKVIGRFFIENSTEPANGRKNYFLRYSLDGTPKIISFEQKTLQDIKGKLNHLASKIKEDINDQAYKLNFEENLELATENISTLLDEISKEEQEINRKDYKTVFEDFEKALVHIQLNLDKLKIQSLWNDTTEILTILRGIRPLPQVNNSPDLVANHGTRVTIEEEQTLLTTFTPPQNIRAPSRLERISSLFKSKSDLPPPPTEEQLQEMGGFKDGLVTHRFAY
jgi:hypothetical protein